MQSAFRIAALCAALFFCFAAHADYPGQREAVWVAKDFKFSTGEVLPEVRLNYITLGQPTGEPVLILHGTGGAGSQFLSKVFGEELFGPGQPLDLSRYYVILPDALGTGKSTRPSDGLKAKFPAYNYDDMVHAQYRLVTEGLGIRHLRLVMGNSMGGMQTWIWGAKYPGFMDALFPMACLPTAMSGRNWILRRMLTQAIRTDPDWNGGNYISQPRNMQRHLNYFALATAGGNIALSNDAPSAELGDKLIADRLNAPFRGDANDLLFQWESSFDYNPSRELERISAWVVAVNSADDERNPPELGIMEKQVKRLKNARYVLIPASRETRGHSTTGMAKFYTKDLAELLQKAPKLP